MHEATPGECTLCDRSCRYFIQNDFFCHLAGPVAPTGKAIVHWIGCINAIKRKFSKCNSFQVTIDLLNIENLKAATAHVCSELQVCNFIML